MSANEISAVTDHQRDGSGVEGIGHPEHAIDEGSP
jgi:hypothetical protein